MSEAMAVFHLPSTSTLSRLIRNGKAWKDGTCFDWALTDPCLTEAGVQKTTFCDKL